MYKILNKHCPLCHRSEEHHLCGITLTKKSYGVIAQEIAEVLPEIVNHTDHYRVNYNALVPFLIEAIKELKQEIDILKNR